MLSKRFEILKISRKGLANCFGIEIRPKHQKKEIKSIYGKLFWIMVMWDLSIQFFLVHVFGEIWLCSS